MGSKDLLHKDREAIAARAIEQLEDLIGVMEKAADQMACGCAPGEIDIKDYQIYMAEGDEQAVVCVLTAEEYLVLLEAAASEAGVCLDDSVKLMVSMPEDEFGECMVTGGFMAYKGMSVERRNAPLEVILECISRKLGERGLNVSCSDEEYVIFSLLVRGRAELQQSGR